jgi:hypothetical protein
MSGSLILQTIGLIFMVEGSIIALYELWRKKLNYICEKQLDRAKKAMVDATITLILKYKEIRRYEKVGKKKVISEKEADEMIDKFSLFIWHHFKRKCYETFRENIIHIGILYLVTGSIFQIVGLWI